MIHSLNHLAHTLKIAKDELLSLVNNDNISKYYQEYEILKFHSDGQPKIDKNGRQKRRIINPSTLKLKEIQKRINKSILNKMSVPKYIFGGAKGKDNVLNAKQHQGKKFKFITDLTNFFPSITNKMVYDMFIAYHFSPDVASLLTKLTTYKGHVPQGAPTSTCIANLVFTKTGNELAQLAKEYNITFTSFVDDLTFSSCCDFHFLVPTIIDIITRNGFIISHQKTFYQSHCPSITGVICYNNRLSVPIYFMKELKDAQSLSPKQYQGKIRYKEKVDRISATKAKNLL